MDRRLQNCSWCQSAQNCGFHSELRMCWALCISCLCTQRGPAVTTRTLAVAMSTARDTAWGEYGLTWALWCGPSHGCVVSCLSVCLPGTKISEKPGDASGNPRGQNEMEESAAVLEK